jgi:putative peptidoglycan lipid II flippase
MMQRIFNRASSSIASGAMVLGLAGLFSRLLGVYRDRLLATTFGAGASLDVYYAAFRIPDFVFNLLVLGALSAGFIPVFSHYLKENKEKAWKLAESVLFLLLVSLGLMSLLVYVFAPWIVPLITPGFSDELMRQTITLTRIMLLSPILLGVSAVFGGVLQTYKRFLAYSLAPIFYNLGIIFGIFFFITPFGIAGLAWGVVLGAGLHLLMQFYIAMKLGWKWTLRDIWQKEGLKEIIHLMGPRTLSLVLLQVNLLIITIFASHLAEGSLSIFNFANNLAHVPVGLFGISFAVSAFPILAKQIAEKKEQEFTQTIYKTVSQILFFLTPTMVFFVLLDEQIVRLVYGAGEFSWESTLLTAKVLLYFVPGIIAQALIPLVSRGFYALKDTKHPLYASIIALILTLITSYLFTFVYTMGVPGLAAAFSISTIVQFFLMVYWLKLPVKHDIGLRQVRSTIIQIVIASIAMLLVLQFTKDLSGGYLDLLTVKGVLTHFLFPGLLGGLAYLGVLSYVGNAEYKYYTDALKGKVRLFEKAFVPTVGTGEEDDTTI